MARPSAQRYLNISQMQLSQLKPKAFEARLPNANLPHAFRRDTKALGDLL